MKKFTKVLSVLLVLFVALLTLTSCGSTTNSSDVIDPSEDVHEFVNGACANCGKQEAEHCKFKDELKGDNGETDKLCDTCNKPEAEHCQYVPLCATCGKSEAHHFEIENETFKLNFETLNNVLEAKDDSEEGYKPQSFVGLFDANKGILYLEEASVPMYETNSNGEKVYIKYQVIVEDEDLEGLPALDKADKKLFGPYFAGWYSTDDLRNSETHPNRLISLKEIREDADGIVYGYYISFVQAILVAVVCILIVFSILMILWGLVSLLKFIAPKQKEQTKQPEAPATPAAAPRQAISIADIKDEDMMVAALVATIDYHEETQEDVRVVSIKEIK